MNLKDILDQHHNMKSKKKRLTAALKNAIGMFLTHQHKGFANSAEKEMFWNEVLYNCRGAGVAKATEAAGVVTINWAKKVLYFTKNNWEDGGSTRAPRRKK